MENFKNCSYCSKQWNTRKTMLDDSNLLLSGYQADLRELEWGLFYFDHKEKVCGTTLNIFTRDFLDLHNGPIYEESKFGTEHCGGHCLDKNDLSDCDAKCKHASARKVVQIIREIEKNRMVLA